MSIDPIALEVLWSRLLSVTNEQQAALMRTAFSTVVRESQDLACGVFDTLGSMVAQSETGTPGHINAMATCMRHFMAAYPEKSLEPGDVLITNDPWMTAGQINDITLVTPIFREFSLETIDPLSEAIIDRSERATRAAIARLPDGVYENEMYSDGFEEPVLLKATVTVDGDELTVDHAGSSPQSRFGINVVMNYTHAYTSFAVKCAISPEVPHNEGSFRPVHVVAPPGCILNAQHPAPVAARHLIGHFLPGLIFGALAKAMPERIMADGAASIWITMFRGTRLTRD